MCALHHHNFTSHRPIIVTGRATSNTEYYASVALDIAHSERQTRSVDAVALSFGVLKKVPGHNQNLAMNTHDAFCI